MQQQCLLLVLLCISFLFPFCDSQEFGSTTQGQVQVWFNGGNNTGNEPFATISIEPFKQSADFNAFLLEVETQLPFIREFCNLTQEEPSRCAPWSWKVYNWRRNRIYTTQNLHGGDLLYMVPVNESFIWPGLYIGHKVTVEVSETENDGTKVIKSYELETISLTPRAFSVSDFLSERECDLVVQLGKESLAASTLGFEATLSTSERNSKTAWLWANDDPEVKRLCDRASFLTHTPVNHQEALQLLHYTGGGYYRSHCDYFGDPSCALRPNPANRFITLLFYLSDVEEGGGTNFMRVKREDETDDPWARDIVNVSCTTGLTVQPKRRKAMMFYNLKPEGYRNQPIGDQMSEHTACNVTKGEKWAANFWIWNHPRAGPADVERTYMELDENFVQPPTESNYYSGGHHSNDQQFGAAVGVEGAGEVAGEATRT